MRALFEALALLWILLREQIDPEDGEERDAARYLAALGEGTRAADSRPYGEEGAA
jgi:hypothetical protein